jgi:hypothetical protein
MHKLVALVIIKKNITKEEVALLFEGRGKVPTSCPCWIKINLSSIRTENVSV